MVRRVNAPFFRHGNDLVARALKSHNVRVCARRALIVTFVARSV